MEDQEMISVIRASHCPWKRLQIVVARARAVRRSKDFDTTRRCLCWLYSTSFLKRDSVYPGISPVRSVFSRLLTRVTQPEEGYSWLDHDGLSICPQVQSAFCPGATGLHLLCSCVSVRRCSAVLVTQLTTSVPDPASKHGRCPFHGRWY